MITGDGSKKEDGQTVMLNEMKAKVAHAEPSFPVRLGANEQGRQRGADAGLHASYEDAESEPLFSCNVSAV